MTNKIPIDEALRLADELKERFGGTVPTSQAAALMLAAQNTATDVEWTYKAEPVQGNTAQLYKVAIYDESAQLLGYL